MITIVPERLTGRLLGLSTAMQEVRTLINQVSRTNSTVLIQGESGTGKELIARELHAQSDRATGPWVVINCGAIPEDLIEAELFGHERGSFTGAVKDRPGRFEMAHHGTIFLDEIGELTPALQVRLLRVLQERSFERVGGVRTIHVDVRVVAATNIDLEKAVTENRFRADLFYRLHIIPILAPTLRSRPEDIPVLAEAFLETLNQQKGTAVTGFDPEVLEQLQRYPWPGNVRELKNLVERLVVLKQTGPLTLRDLPDKLLRDGEIPGGVIRTGLLAPEMFPPDGIDLVAELERYEEQLIVQALLKSQGVVSKAASLLKLNRTTLVEKIKRKRLGRSDYQSLTSCDT